MQHPPTAFVVDSEIDFVLPHNLLSAGLVTDVHLGFALSLALWFIWPRYIYLLCVVPFYVFVLLAPEFLPLLEGMWLVAELWMS